MDIEREGQDIELKRDHRGLEPGDLVAFANSPAGGSIVLGIEDPVNGKPIEVSGCAPTDEVRLSILNKAQSCSPPIHLEIQEEQHNGRSCTRIDVPPGDHKPYCTASGKYLTRGDSRNNPLHPPQLLQVFLDRESEQFVSRFRRAADEVVDSLVDAHEKLESISFSAANADAQAEEAIAYLTEIPAWLEDLERKLNDDNWRSYDLLDAIMQHFNIEDPSIRRMKDAVITVANQYLRSKQVLRLDYLVSAVQQQVPPYYPTTLVRNTCEIALIAERERRRAPNA